MSCHVNTAFCVSHTSSLARTQEIKDLVEKNRALKRTVEYWKEEMGKERKGLAKLRHLVTSSTAVGPCPIQFLFPLPPFLPFRHHDPTPVLVINLFLILQLGFQRIYLDTLSLAPLGEGLFMAGDNSHVHVQSLVFRKETLYFNIALNFAAVGSDCL